MSIARRDYVLRMIEQLSAAMARVVGLRTSGKLDEAERLLRETAGGIFGPMRDMLDALDAASAAMLLSSPEKTRIYAELTAEMAEIHAARGAAVKARAGRRRALELYLLALPGEGEIDHRTREAIGALRAGVDEARLDARYREALARL